MVGTTEGELPKCNPECTPLFLFDVEKEPRKASVELLPLEFESHRVWLIVIDGTPWLVLSDIARILGYRDARDANRILHEHQTGTHKVRTPGGEQERLVVNESGLYRLLIKSERPVAERFQDWLRDEVLPSIHCYGTYRLQRRDRVAKVAGRLKTDIETAKTRCDQFDTNRAADLRLAVEGTKPRAFAA
jgi:prophage antirepressor-like protein